MTEELVHLSWVDVAELAGMLSAAADKHLSARVVVQDHGLKLSISGRSWSVPYGVGVRTPTSVVEVGLPADQRAGS